MPAALMIGHHFAISAFCIAATASGVCCSRGGMTKPWSTSFWRMAGSCVVPTAAALSLSMMSLGVPLGGEQTRPQRELEPGEPRFLRRGDFGRDCDAVLGGDRKRLDPARADVRQRGSGVGDRHVDLPANQI